MGSNVGKYAFSHGSYGIGWIMMSHLFFKKNVALKSTFKRSVGWFRDGPCLGNGPKKWREIPKDGITRSFKDFGGIRHQDLVKDQSSVACEKIDWI